MIFKFALFVKRPVNTEKAQGLVEYSFIIGFIALALIIALATLGSKLIDFFNMVSQQIQLHIL